MSGNMIQIPLLPQGQCLLWDFALLWLHVIADAVIATAYYSIPSRSEYWSGREEIFP